MEKLNIFKKTLTCMTSTALMFALVTSYPKATGRNSNTTSAESIAEMQEQISENKTKIAELQNKLDALSGSKAQEKEYQNVLNEQINVIQNNIDLLNKELESISSDIESAQTNIADLNQSIIDQQTAIDDKIELFKQRLCAMYIAGNDNLATVVVGTSSFYDMMSRVEMVNRIASHDEELIDNILIEIDEMEESKKKLESEKLTLEMKLDEQTKRKEQKAAEMDDLYEKMRETKEEIERIEREESMAESQKADLMKMNDDFDAKIEAEIAAQAAAAQAAYEERIRAEQAAAQQQGGTSYSPSYSDPPYIPAPSASGFSWPAPGFCYISSPYGYRWGTVHRGIDVGDAGIHGGAAVASKAGTVVYVANSCTHDYPKSSSCGCGGGYGNYVLISHDGTYSTLYGHLSSAAVSVGQSVSQGQVIGYIGSSGWSTGAHLHFEVRVNGVAQNPQNYVSP